MDEPGVILVGVAYKDAQHPGFPAVMPSATIALPPFTANSAPKSRTMAEPLSDVTFTALPPN